MHALAHASCIYVHCGDYYSADALLAELAQLADEKGAALWNAYGLMTQGALRLLTGKPSDAVRLLTSGLNAFQLTGATVFVPWYLTYLATAYASLNQYDDAFRTISEATETVDRTNERWCEAEVARVAGEVALLGPKQDSAKGAEAFRARTRRRTPTTSKILGTPRRHEPRTPLARPGQGAASARTACSGLRLVHEGFRHARSEGGEGVAGGVSVLGDRVGR